MEKIIFLAAFICTTTLPAIFGQGHFGGRFGEFQEHDLLHAIGVPFNNPKMQFFDEGLDGFPAYGLKPGSDIKSPYRLFMPEKLYSEFAITTTIRPNGKEEGFLFSVVNPLETVVQLGVELIPSGHLLTNISLLYTDVNAYITSQKIASFVVPSFVKKWTRFSLRVSAENVTLFFNCNEFDTIQVRRIPQELVFDSASTLYVGQAGPIIKGAFHGSFQELKLYGNPSQAESQCVVGYSSKDGSGLGDFGDLFVDQEEGEDGNSAREGSGGVDSGPNLPPFPPPPPGLDGFLDPVLQKFLCEEDSDDPTKRCSGFPTSRGEKGERGPKGPPGDCVRGPPGPPGLSGPPGIPGTPGGFSELSGFGSGSGDEQIFGEGYGPPGQCSCNMTQILQSFTMPEMLQGPPGPPGTDGKTGAPGLTGQAGPAGERGAVGSRGERGERGDGGSPGVEGPRGPKGEAGLDGKPGTPGPPGPPGPTSQPDHATADESVFGTGMGSGLGRPGTPGPKGEPGPAGSIGIQGERGFAGHKGERGDVGQKGPKGDRGYQGPVGPHGVKGDRGPSGIDGLPGLPGANGQPADKGEKGEYGPMGKPGPPGPPGPPISDGASGDEWAYSASGGGVERNERGVEGPKGDKGEIGAKGEKGSRGVEGPQGFPGNDGKVGERGQLGPSGLPGIEGPSGAVGLKGDRGDRGPPGPISVATGSDFVTVKGDKGDTGARGKRGKPGVAGIPGRNGTMGDIGLPGYMGRPGNMGPQGPPGVAGLKGEKGDSAPAGMYGFGGGQKGERGYDGTPGVPGLDGARGPPGPIGPPGPRAEFIGGHSGAGVPGPPGPPGPPGQPGLSLIGQKGEPGMTMRHVYGDTSFSQSRQVPGYHPRRPTHSPDEESSSGRVVPGALTFQNTEAMIKMSDVTPVGTMAYIIDEEALLVRVTNGWQYIAMGSILPITTPPAPTTAPPQARPVFEASNLIKNVPIPEDGPSLRMAALNEPVTGNLQGVRGADYACYRQARRAGLTGTFRAFLSSRDQNIYSIVKSAERELPVVNIKGDILFNSWVELFDGPGGLFSHTPRIYGFSGKNILTDPVWPQKIVWHGSHAQGERAMETYCDAWHSDSIDKVGLASSLHGNKLLDEERFSCNNRFILLCIEVSSQSSRRRKRDLRSFNQTIHEQGITNADDYQDFLEDILSD